MSPGLGRGGSDASGSLPSLAVTFLTAFRRTMCRGETPAGMATMAGDGRVGGGPEKGSGCPAWGGPDGSRAGWVDSISILVRSCRLYQIVYTGCRLRCARYPLRGYTLRVA